MPQVSFPNLLDPRNNLRLYQAVAQDMVSCHLSSNAGQGRHLIPQLGPHPGHLRQSCLTTETQATASHERKRRRPPFGWLAVNGRRLLGWQEARRQAWPWGFRQNAFRCCTVDLSQGSPHLFEIEPSQQFYQTGNNFVGGQASEPRQPRRFRWPELFPWGGKCRL